MFKITKERLKEDKEVRGLIMDTYKGMEHKEHFAVLDNFSLEGEGYLFKAIEEESGELAAAFILLYPGLSEENLSYDLDFPEESLKKTAIADVAVTKEKYRGHSLQRRLMTEGEKTAFEEGYRYLLCTIHPDNMPSLKSALSLGYEIKKTTRKYGGLVRHILEKELFPLKGKTIIFLGSSVTYGECSGGFSFADFLQDEEGISSIKEAVSGTTLTLSANSYIERMERIPAEKADLFICQLSTNDASQKRSLGSLEEENPETITGALRYVINYVSNRWACPILFYTSPYYPSKEYEEMVLRLEELSGMLDFRILNLYREPRLSLTQEEKDKYMHDDIHPLLAGYKELWLPYFRKALFEVFF